MSNSKVIGVIALKGGVGKTSVVANLGTTIAKDYGKKVLLVDANFSTPHLGLHVGLVNPKKSLHHVLQNKISTLDAIYDHELGFHILPGSIAPLDVNPLVLKEKIDTIKENYDVVLIDSSPSLQDEMYATMAASDELLVVSSPDYPTLSATLHAIKVAKKKNAPIRGIVINKVRGKRFELSKRDIESASETKVLSVLPDDVKVLEALSTMTPVSSFAPRREVSNEYRKLAGVLLGEERKGKFLSRALKGLSFGKTKKEGS